MERPTEKALAGTRDPAGRRQVLHARDQTVGALDSWLAGLGEEAGSAHALLGFDFPIGIPAAYATLAGITDFKVALEGFDDRFYAVAAQADEICLGRPFYPMRPGRCRREQLLEGLGLAAWCDLLRRCERRSATRPEACALFWTLGGNQVGKAAIAGWRDLLAPALRADVDLALWPFQGKLDVLLARHRFVVVETYPAEVYDHLGLSLRRDGGKRNQGARRRAAGPLLAKLRDLCIEPDPGAREEIENGFGAGADGEDRFDAVVGLVGMLQVVLRGEPDDQVIRRVEGWILGQSATP